MKKVCRHLYTSSLLNVFSTIFCYSAPTEVSKREVNIEHLGYHMTLAIFTEPSHQTLYARSTEIFYQISRSKVVLLIRFIHLHQRNLACLRSPGNVLPKELVHLVTPTWQRDIDSKVYSIDTDKRVVGKIPP